MSALHCGTRSLHANACASQRPRRSHGGVLAARHARRVPDAPFSEPRSGAMSAPAPNSGSPTPGRSGTTGVRDVKQSVKRASTPSPLPSPPLKRRRSSYAGVETPLMMSHSASVTSNTPMGIHTNSGDRPRRESREPQGKDHHEQDRRHHAEPGEAAGIIRPRGSHEEEGAAHSARGGGEGTRHP